MPRAGSQSAHRPQTRDQRHQALPCQKEKAEEIMLKTFPAAEPRAPSTLAAVAAALVTCTHPASSHVLVSAHAATWCAACGALRAGGGGEPAAWLAARLPSLLTRKHFEEVILVLHCIRQLTLLTQREASPGSAVQGAFRRVRASLSELARLPIVRDVDRLDEAIAELPQSLLRP
jgi:hypothetical protein